jgi:ABC-type transporter lipoprotein component MlaA
VNGTKYNQLIQVPGAEAAASGQTARRNFETLGKTLGSWGKLWQKLWGKNFGNFGGNFGVGGNFGQTLSNFGVRPEY